VHDGVVIIESDDIIDYIDQTFPETPLHPAAAEEIESMYWWMKSAVDIHVKAVKTFIYFHKMQGKMKQTDEQKDAYEKLQTNEELIAFHKNTDKGFTAEQANEAMATLDHFFKIADGILQDRDWLVGEQFTLADITWVPMHFTLAGAGYDFSRFPAVQAWASRFQVRESFKKGVLDWCPTF
jgi:glutathione S-transferase